MALAHGKNIPNVNTPRRGPPMMPKILRAASRTFPRLAATNTKPKQSTPKPRASILEIRVAFASSMLGNQKGRTKSSRKMAASEFSPLDTVLETKRW